ncbi:McrC family protein [Paenibacillus chitinolyticus]|uniref:McrC family protein n=1 Tax=Paenibacillus chitinolyticus TaxID=79263 RepID=UPI001C469F4D|nr:McrC family protein [Paenibacillus chitinolyticus]MBV6716565.1 McrC family protein [Paenibacillus chitinolyticus]
MKTRVTLKEYGTICKNPSGIPLGYHHVDGETFDRLERFVLENRALGNGTDALELMTVASRRGIGKIISAKNHVGVIAIPDGGQIEILPKFYDRDLESSDAQAKQIFLQMLRTIEEIPNKQFSKTNLSSEKNDILDIFIRMFIEETSALVKRGLKSDYEEHQDNEYFFKGKLQISRHLRLNAAHKERFYVAYDEYSMNQPENRLIKTTVERLMKVSGRLKTRKDLYVLLTELECVESSVYPEQDWAHVSADRTVKEYKTILGWCRLFLSGQSFSPFRGDSLAYALLYPMELVFERYIAELLKAKAEHPKIRVKVQYRMNYLFQKPTRFQLKPDVVVEGPSGVAVIDTKWKLLTHTPDYGISQGDMYQAYAYGKKYGASSVYLIYKVFHRLRSQSYMIAETVLMFEYVF